MPVEVSWLVDEAIILNHFVGVMTEDELIAFNQTMHDFLDSSSRPLVHNFVDMRQMEAFGTLAQIRKHFTFPKHERFGWVIFVGITNPVIKMVLGIGPQLFNLRFRQVKSIDEGLAFFQYVDSTLPDLKPYAERIPDYVPDAQVK